MEEKTPLLVVTGPTASGKTRLSIDLARCRGGEIVCADSMQIYKEMQIATAKPTPEEMGGVPHHLFDFLDLDEEFSVAQYCRRAKEAIAHIAGRGKLPMLVGGTGLYIHSLIDNVDFDQIKTNEPLRKELCLYAQENGNEALFSRLKEIDPALCEKLHPNNLYRVIRAIEVYHTTGVPMSELQRKAKGRESPYALCMIGIAYDDRQKLYDRVNLRVDQMLEAGLLEEARDILSRDAVRTARQAIGYKELIGYLNGEIPLEEAVENLKRETRRYAKRQLTWFRRDPRIQWIYPDLLHGYDEVFLSAQKILEKSGIL
ncbi:tRNA (adenosine(37)-N6)-dimethylallyltransferase MiaA [Zongyangia hominis]|uniref:tRNA dimethylallyltransferase n=1 Tax=Zongyangia hominis TaxID=2763677 RepID=A0A926IB06_9FIRM|nr:tRNA (adenosine(37)-N6)-dimethylallyltransferase MiaA [Zongyangia hominis]MBC8569640.1 tRNA (adenosine(37)-N6)-dimethylallyltransferase MiaA [Zongyangia hominis]